MWKIMIADDEPKIRRGLRSNIEKLGLDACVCAEAEDGELALRAVTESKPDIVLVDICMPFLNGLQFIDALKDARENMKIIIVTGYDEFEYARKALEFKVFAYLLKPVPIDELRRTVKDATTELSNKRNRDKYFDWAVQQMEKRREYLREAFLKEWLDGALSDAEIDEQKEFFGVELGKETGIILVAPRQNAAELDMWSQSLLRFAVKNILDDILARCSSAYTLSDDRGQIIAIFDCEGVDSEKLTRETQQILTNSMNIPAYIDYTVCRDASKLYEAYDVLLERVIEHTSHTPAVTAAKRYIDKNYAKIDIGLNEAAEAAGINPTYLSRLMKQELGMSFSKYLTGVRIKRALELMRDPEIKIKSISERVGYSTPHYFSTAFKKVVGISPADYRNEENNK